jgi:hypothetical protein
VDQELTDPEAHAALIEELKAELPKWKWGEFDHGNNRFWQVGVSKASRGCGAL